MSLEKRLLILLVIVLGGGLLWQFATGFALWLHRSQAPPLSPKNFVWALATSTAPWGPRDAQASVVFKDKLWIFGGVNGGALGKNYVEYWKLPHLNDIWRTSDTRTWQSRSAPWGGRRSHSVVEFKGQLYMLAGWGPASGYQSDVWVSADGFTWNLIEPAAAWPAREGQVVLVWRDRLWLMGGINFDTHEVFNDVWVSADGLVWQKEATPPWPARYDHAAIVWDGKLWLLGGVKEGGGFSDLWQTADGREWFLVEATAPWGPRHGAALLAWHDHLWLWGGWRTDLNRGMADGWYSPDGQVWRPVKVSSPWIGREDHAINVFRDRVWLFGGMGNNWEWQSDLWQGGLGAAPSESAALTAPPLAAAAFALTSLTDRPLSPGVSVNPNLTWPIASITKLVSAIVVLEDLPLEAELVIQDRDVAVPEAYGQLAAGDRLTVRELLHSMLIESSNDATMALAGAIGDERFVNLMNQIADRFGLENTKFFNPTGLDPALVRGAEGSEPNYSTVADLEKLLLAIANNYWVIFEIGRQSEYDVYLADGRWHHLARNTNRLLDASSNLKILGGKTGETARARKNLVMLSAVENDQMLASIVLGAADNFAATRELLDWREFNDQTPSS